MTSPSKLIVPALLLIGLLSHPVAVPAVQAADPASPHEERPMDIPRLTIGDIRTDNRYGRTVLSLSISQETPTTLQVPILIRTGVGDIRFSRMISALKTTMDFVLPDPPLEVILDPDFELLREPEPSEVPLLWSRFLEAKEKTVVLASAESGKIFAPLLEYLQLQQTPVKIAIAEEIKNADLSMTAILFLGADNAAGRTLFAGPTTPSDGFTLDVRNNPLNQHHVAVLVSSSSVWETKAAVQRLPQYQDASFLHFKKGKLVKKRKQEGIPGQHYTLEQLPAGAPVSAVRDFAKIIDQVADSRVVYIGETHTSASDHLLQFRIIQALYKKNPHLAIGMEMFPSTAQQALDEYVMGDTGMDEKDFLKKSQFFQVWGYDWRLFRNIFNFARMNRIPIVALNLDRKIVSDVFKTGSTDNLTPEQKRALPADRDLDLPGYPDRLNRMHDFHGRMEAGHGPPGFGGFIQAQGIWDETMAQNIATFLVSNPAAKMVVLAGVQHIRKDSGIPPRVTRRIPVGQCSVLNILSENAPADVVDIADFIFMAPPVSIPPSAKLGIVLEQEGAGDSSGVRITGLSPHGKAGAAGLQENDILLAIDGHSVYDMDDVQIAMLDAVQGQTITVRVRRGAEQEMEYQVPVRTPKMDRPHP